MKLSKEAQYSLLGVLSLAGHGGEMVQVARVAEETGVAAPFLAKSFSRLSRAGVLKGYRGRSRGYVLARPASMISVRDVVEAIEGPDLFRRCIFWGESCSEVQPCPLHGVWAQIRPRLAQMLAETTIQDLIEGRSALDPQLSVQASPPELAAI
jgi:Rrf2 family protein